MTSSGFYTGDITAFPSYEKKLGCEDIEYHKVPFDIVLSSESKCFNIE